MSAFQANAFQNDAYQVAISHYELSALAYSLGSPSFAQPVLRILGETMPQITGPTVGPSTVLVLTYDATGLAEVFVEGWPLVGWCVDEVAPINPIPVTIGNPFKSVPDTTPIVSPVWAFALNESAVYVPGQWRGTLYEFFTWICTNNGADRKIAAWLALAVNYNTWHQWAREHPSRVL